MIDTPVRKHTIKQVVHRCYTTVASRLVQGSVCLENLLTSLGRIIRSELRQLSLLENNSILRDSVNAVKYFTCALCIYVHKYVLQDLENELQKCALLNREQERNMAELVSYEDVETLTKELDEEYEKNIQVSGLCTL